MSLSNIFDRLEAQENASAGTRVLAPVLAARRVCVRVAGVQCQLQIEGEARGWSVLEVVSMRRAKWLRAATRGEVGKYLALLPAVRFLALEGRGEVWFALPAHRGDARFALRGLAPIRGADGANLQAFDCFVARFDGTHFWFEAPDARRSPALAEYLRASLATQTAPGELHKKGLSAEERAAYAWALWGPPETETAPVVEEIEAPSLNPYARGNWGLPSNLSGPQGRLANSLAHAGGRLVSYIDRGDAYTVTYQFGERTHTSTVRADDLSVMTSGICLSGYDREFDLTSLVGVMQEAASSQPWQFGDDYDY